MREPRSGAWGTGLASRGPITGYALGLLFLALSTPVFAQSEASCDVIPWGAASYTAGAASDTRLGATILVRFDLAKTPSGQDWKGFINADIRAVAGASALDLSRPDAWGKGLTLGGGAALTVWPNYGGVAKALYGDVAFTTALDSVLLERYQRRWSLGLQLADGATFQVRAGFGHNDENEPAGAVAHLPRQFWVSGYVHVPGTGKNGSPGIVMLMANFSLNAWGTGRDTGSVMVGINIPPLLGAKP